MNDANRGAARTREVLCHREGEATAAHIFGDDSERTRSHAPRGNAVWAAPRPLPRGRPGRRGASRNAFPRRAWERVNAFLRKDLRWPSRCTQQWGKAPAELPISTARREPRPPGNGGVAHQLLCSRGAGRALSLISLCLFGFVLTGSPVRYRIAEAVQLRGVDPNAGPFVGNRNSKVFHLATCSALKRTSPTSKIEVPNTQVASANGFRPCGICRPLGAVKDMALQTTTAFLSTPAAQATEDDEDASTRFSRDIAPVLVGNCIDCHNPKDKARRNNLDLTTFQSLLKGGDSGPAVVSGNPGESPLVLRIKGEGIPKMPPGNRELAPETITLIEQWVASGARLDAGVDPAAALSKYAPDVEEMRQEELARLSPEELDQRVEEAGLGRWKKATSTAPTVTSSGRFMLFGELPEKRAEVLLKVMNAQYASLRSLLGPEAVEPSTEKIKIGLYVFNDPVAYAEFVRSVENREVDTTDTTHGQLDVPMPYLASIDPLLGREEPSSKRDGDATVPERSLAGLLSEHLGREMIKKGGNPPRWLNLGDRRILRTTGRSEQPILQPAATHGPRSGPSGRAGGCPDTPRRRGGGAGGRGDWVQSARMAGHGIPALVHALRSSHGQGWDQIR